MEEISISKAKEQEILSRLRRSQVTLIISAIAFLFAGVALYLVGPTYFPFFILPYIIICTPLCTMYYSSMKLIKTGKYKAYSSVCRKKGHWLAATIWVDNNEILSEHIKNPLKKLEAAGGDDKKYFSGFEVGKEVGIIQTGKKFWVFFLEESASEASGEPAPEASEETTPEAKEEPVVEKEAEPE